MFLGRKREAATGFPATSARRWSCRPGTMSAPSPTRTS